MEIHEMKTEFEIDERVGSYLRRIRESQGLELEQLSKAIRLGKNILQSIEENKWDSFPTEAYLRSYIASICDKLSLDKHEVLRKFSIETNSHFGILQNRMVDKNDPNSESSSGNMPKIITAIILVFLVIVFLIFKSMEGGEKQSYGKTLPTAEESDPLDAEEAEIAADSSLDSDSLLAAQEVAANAAVKDPNAKDTLRFECKRLETEKFCGGVKQQGADEGMRYFNNTTSRYLTHKDTTQIVVSVPWRTKLFVNGSQIDYVKDNHNTFLFYEGRIVNSYYKKL
jgi:transcriptional regulator with XRE-family HTH domain